MMALHIHIHSHKEKTEIWRQVFHRHFEGEKLLVTSAKEHGDYQKADFVVQGMDEPLIDFSNMPNLKAIASPGAGVDHILFDENMKLIWPEHIPVLRLRDEILGIKASDYVLMRALYFNLHMHNYRLYQKQKKWKQHQAGFIERIGVLGLGDMGMTVAKRLKQNHFEVCGWRKHKNKDNQNLPVFTAIDGLLPFLRSCNFIVNCLPLTQETYGLINKFRLEKAPVNSCFINIGRAATVKNDELMQLLSAGHIAHAYIDVFDSEPLAEDSPYWQHPQIHLTPHIAAIHEPARTADILSSDFKKILEKQKANGQIDYQLQY